jgi:major membrane immunogen (membrane-anchored lipoprotein)
MSKAGITGVMTVVMLLSACGKTEKAQQAANSNAPKTAEQVATAMGKVTLQPGEWEIRQQVVDMHVSGAPKGMPVDAMRSAMGKVNVVKHCVTPEQAAKPNADFLAAQKDMKCTYSGFDMSAGIIHGAVTCPNGQGGTMTAKMQGVYHPTDYALTMDMTMAGVSPGMTMKMKMKTDGKRVGECAPTERVK